MSPRYVGVGVGIFLLFTCWAHAETVQVVAEKANLRSQPSTGSTIVAPLTKGALLDVIEKVDMWLRVKVRDTGAEGYIHSALVGPVAASGASTPPPPPPPTVHAPMTPEQPPASWAPSAESSIPRSERKFRISAFLGVGYVGDYSAFAFGGGVGVFPFSNRAMEIAGDLSYGSTNGFGETLLTAGLLYNFDVSGSRIRPYAGGGFALLSGDYREGLGFHFRGGMHFPITESMDVRGDLLIAPVSKSDSFAGVGNLTIRTTAIRVTGGISF